MLFTGTCMGKLKSQSFTWNYSEVPVLALPWVWKLVTGAKTAWGFLRRWRALNCGQWNYSSGSSCAVGLLNLGCLFRPKDTWLVSFGGRYSWVFLMVKTAALCLCVCVCVCSYYLRNRFICCRIRIGYLIPWFNSLLYGGCYTYHCLNIKRWKFAHST